MSGIGPIELGFFRWAISEERKRTPKWRVLRRLVIWLKDKRLDREEKRMVDAFVTRREPVPVFLKRPK